MVEVLLMLMCLCYGISCNEIKSLVCEGIMTTEGIQEKCHAGTGCGCCLEELERLVANECCRIANTPQLITSHAPVEQDNSQVRYP